MALSMFAPDSVALVTGASSGIGRAIAHQLVGDGIRSIALLDISPNLLEEEAALKEAYPKVQTLALSVDVANEENVDLAIAKTVAEFGRIDVAVHAAGIGGGIGPTAEMESKDMEKILNINLKGAWFCERAVLRQMLKQEWRDATTGLPVRVKGSIVNVGSIYSLTALPSLGPYTMAKHALLGLTKVDGIENATQGIRINCVCPGFVRTNLNGGIGWETEEIRARIERTPAKRFGLAEEVAYTVSFLASDRASYITGTSIAVDGGYTAA